MPDTKTYYKVVDFIKNCSAILSYDDDACIVYKENEWVRRRKGNGPLCVFDDYEKANKFRNNYGGLIFACEIEPSKQKSVWHYPEHYAKGEKEKILTEFKFLPKGTVLANAVKLIRRVP